MFKPGLTNDDSHCKVNDIASVQELAVVSKDGDTLTDARHLGKFVTNIVHAFFHY